MFKWLNQKRLFFLLVSTFIVIALGALFLVYKEKRSPKTTPAPNSSQSPPGYIKLEENNVPRSL